MKSNFKRILVTAALPYANGYVHLGHLAGAYLPSDMYVRYQRLKGRDVLFLCGSDEHGVAIMVTAEKEKSTPKQIIDRYHPANRKAFEDFGMSFDHYSRTSIPLHHETTQEFFKNLQERRILKEKEEKQLYCEKDKMFLADRYVGGTCPNCGYVEARGDQCENCGTWLNQVDLIDPKCKICGTTPVVRETTHLYFPLGQFQSRLEQYIGERNKRDGWKSNVLRYCESWFKEGLQDRAVTRDLSWGVKVPVAGYEKKVIYVWFDAVLGYISAAKEWAQKAGTREAWRDYWLNDDTKYVAFIGKDNIVFHCIVFPAMLMAWNDSGKDRYVLPENVPANEFLNFEGQKFSKSRGWGIDVSDFLRFFPPDTLRYALATGLPEMKDADFYLKDFQARVNNELADTLGNFVNRTFSFVERNFGGKVPAPGKQGRLEKEIVGLLGETPSKVGDLFERYSFREATFEAMNLARAGNKYFNDTEPWKTVVSKPDQCATSINICLQVVRCLAIILEPVVPLTSRKIWSMLNEKGSIKDAGWDSAARLALAEGHLLNKSSILIDKIEDNQIDEVVKFLEKGKMPETQEAPGQKPTLSIDDFRKVDLRLARVVSAERIPKSDKLLKLSVEIGTERRQVVAGIAQHYTPEQLTGKMVVVVANLQPAKLMGQESQGMILAANDNNGKLSIITVQEELSSGSVVR